MKDIKNLTAKEFAELCKNLSKEQLILLRGFILGVAGRADDHDPKRV